MLGSDHAQSEAPESPSLSALRVQLDSPEGDRQDLSEVQTPEVVYRCGRANFASSVKRLSAAIWCGAEDGQTFCYGAATIS